MVMVKMSPKNVNEILTVFLVHQDGGEEDSVLAHGYKRHLPDPQPTTVSEDIIEGVTRLLSRMVHDYLHLFHHHPSICIRMV